MSLFLIPKGFVNWGSGAVVMTESDGTVTTNALSTYTYWPKYYLGLESHEDRLLAVPFVSASNSWRWLVQIHRRSKREEIIHLLTRFEKAICSADEGTMMLSEVVQPIAPLATPEKNALPEPAQAPSQGN